MIYFDHAATSMPKPRAVLTAMLEAMKRCGNSGRSGHAYALASSETVYNCRKKLASLFGTRPECVVFTSSATEALNIAIKGTNRSGGVTLVSNLEHNAVMRPLHVLRQRGEAVLRSFAVDIHDDDVTAKNFATVSRSATSVVITHASNVCGRILPVQRLRSLVSDETVFILDASQSAGHIPVNIVSLGVDIICIPAHKGLLGPMGLGALIINPFSDIVIDPVIEGGTGTNSKSLDMPELLPERLESGTQNVIGIAGLSSALDGFSLDGAENELFRYLVSGMRMIKNVTLHGAPERGEESDFVPVLLFNKKGYDCESLAGELSDRGFALRAGFHCAPNAHKAIGTYDTGGVRVSLGKTNTKRDIDRFLENLDNA